jgi:acyl transferase domain-containing protein
MEPIAITGIGCRFPAGVSTPQELWHLLANGTDAISKAPDERRELYQAYDPHAASATSGKIVTLQGGFLQDIDAFDASFFGLLSREVNAMDPQQRLLLEVAWESLENAGYVPLDLAGSETGVFLGMWTNDYQDTLYTSLKDIDLYTTTGTGRYAASGRLAYQFDLRGPSMTIDTACSSSLVAIHLACQSLRCGECDLALAGGSNLILQPHLSIGYSRSKMLSLDGRCRFGDQAADGYVRSEGVAIIVLKRLVDALADKDYVYAVIRTSAVNNNGRSGGVIVRPGNQALEQLMQTVYRKARIAPGDVQYVEAHGTGTAVGDVAELQAIGSFMSEGHTGEQPCYVGSIKTNIGHTEGASGVAGVIKLALSLKHRLIPASLHCKTPHPAIPWDTLPITIPGQLTRWPDNGAVARASVNSYGIAGTNAHILMEEAPVREDVGEDQQHTRPYHLLTLSAKSEAALRQLALRYYRYLQQPEPPHLGNICFTTHIGRTHFAHRLALVAASNTEMGRQLHAFLHNEDNRTHLFYHSSDNLQAPNVAFVFGGQCIQKRGAGYQLYESDVTFRHEVTRCAEIAERYLVVPFVEALFASNEELDTNNSAKSIESSIALFALTYALAKMWQAWGILPDVILDDAAGVYVAACIAGILSLEDALRLTVAQARWIQASVLPDEAERRRSEAEAERAFMQITDSLAYTPPVVAYISTLSGSIADEELCTANYWCHYARKIVSNWPYDLDRAYSVEELLDRGCTSFIEISTQSPGNVSPSFMHLDGHKKIQWLPSLGQDDWKTVLQSLSSCYTQGITINWNTFESKSAYRRIPLPTYTFQRERYPLVHTDGTQATASEAQRQSPLLRDLLKTVPVARKQQAMQMYLGDVIVDLLGLDPTQAVHPQRGFWELGMTSLMATELVDRLQQAVESPLPPTLPFDHPTIQSMSTYLLHEITMTDDTTGQRTKMDTQKEVKQQRQALSEEDISALLEKELDALSGKSDR